MSSPDLHNLSEVDKYLRSCIETKDLSQIGEEESDFLSQTVPGLIRQFHEQEMSQATGLKQVLVSRLAASSFLSYDQVIRKLSGNQSISKNQTFVKEQLEAIKGAGLVDFCLEAEYKEMTSRFSSCLKESQFGFTPLSQEAKLFHTSSAALADLLGIEWTPEQLAMETLLPPHHITGSDLMEYNQIAFSLNRQMEKRRLTEYRNTLAELYLSKEGPVLDTNKSRINAVRRDVHVYDLIIQKRYADLDENQISALKKHVKALAGILTIKPPDLCYDLDEPFPLIGSDDSMNDCLAKAEWGQDEIKSTTKFFLLLLRFDLLTSLINLSIHRAKTPRLWFDRRSEIDSQIKRLSKIGRNLGHFALDNEPSIENWENLLSGLLVYNQKFNFLTLDHAQKTGQKQWLYHFQEGPKPWLLSIFQENEAPEALSDQVDRLKDYLSQHSNEVGWRLSLEIDNLETIANNYNSLDSYYGSIDSNDSIAHRWWCFGMIDVIELKLR